MNEQEIICLISERDEQGMTELLKHYGPLMKYVIAPILSNPQDREDCLQEIVMRIWEKIAQFDPARGSWNAWVTSIARNAALNRVRQQKAALREEDALEGVASEEPTPEEHVLIRERQEAILKALQQLSAKERAMFYRKYYYLQPTAQIASEMGMSDRAVEGKLYRIKKRLRKLLGGEGYE